MALAAYDDILIIQTAFIGDLILSIPLIKKTRALWPQSRISILVRKGLGDFVARSGLADHVYEVDKADPAAWRQTSGAIRARPWGLVLSPHQSPRTLLLVRSLRAQMKIGYRSVLGTFIFNRHVTRPMALPEALRQLALLMDFDPSLSALFAAYGEQALTMQTPLSEGTSITHLPAVPAVAEMQLQHFTDARLRWQFDQTTASLAARVQDTVAHLASGKRLALLAPGSVWNTKRWTPEGYAGVANELMREGWNVILTGAPNEKDLCDQVALMAPGLKVIAGELSIWESADLMAVADLVVANDSGAMHMASLSGAPTVAIFGPTVLTQGYRPWQTNVRVVETDLKCRPCGKHGADKCPLGTHACMKQISAQSVLKAAAQVVRPATQAVGR